ASASDPTTVVMNKAGVGGVNVGTTAAFAPHESNARRSRSATSAADVHGAATTRTLSAVDRTSVMSPSIWAPTGRTMTQRRRESAASAFRRLVSDSRATLGATVGSPL